MISFKTIRDPRTGKEVVEIPLTGHELLECPMFNKGSAFPEEERRELGLMGLLPPHVSTIEEQLDRNYENYRLKSTDLGRYVFLTGLQDRNEILFYRLVEEHITEMMPVIYTPVVGEACQNYSHIYRKPRGIFVSYPLRHELEAILANVPYPGVEVIVVTDGERILGLGDQGAGGMAIPVGKLSLYTLCAGIHPASGLPILLDAGTDNQNLIDDPLYLGWRHERVRGREYDDFIKAFVGGILRRFPNALLQWEDFSKHNAPRILERYRDRLCTFNDDIQGTGATALAGLLAASDTLGCSIKDHRVVILGAGSAAIGISDQITAAAHSAGASESEAKGMIWLVDSRGLVLDDRENLEAFKKRYAQPAGKFSGWKLEEVVRNVKPTVLIGAGSQPGAFTEAIVREMARGTARPVIFPLSNPTSKSEADPADLFRWTSGRALVATGSPFPDVQAGGKSVRVGQCNNAFIFPGVGLGVLISGAKRVTNAMFVAAAKALSQRAPIRKDPEAPLYPALEEVREVSRQVAMAVAAEAAREGVATALDGAELEERLNRKIWKPEYPRLRKSPSPLFPPPR